ncbi:hypothetical protein K505DRAFT_360987 [Melanomma pulvis-pyrius CBS 109.77]|uniref:Uncharacterized protein n=1 Tax=Melanomma pulvis-pyrius CBS 109.77 TaxID=1314802 RepID=A0A6A6XET2_9PLEO|nr:hypothetical protein K505DRAFT_360987 [Melanomma pulvis-pyrius CBS 109.77]
MNSTNLPCEPSVFPPNEVLNRVRNCTATDASEVEDIIVDGKVRLLTYSTGKDFIRKYGVTPGHQRTPGPVSVPPYLMKILLRDSAKDNNINFSSAQSLGDVDVAAAEELIENLQEYAYRGNGTVIRLLCPKLESVLDQQPLKEPGMAFEIKSEVIAMPFGGTLNLVHSEMANWIQDHALTGIKVWVVYPPSVQNLGQMGLYYERVSQGNELNHFETCKSLQGGVTILQKPGQKVWIPPFCPTVVLALTTCTSFSTRFAMVDGTLQKLQNIPLLRAKSLRNRTEKKQKEEQRLLARQICKELQTILTEDEEGVDPHKIIILIAGQWEQLKDDLRLLLQDGVVEGKKRIKPKSILKFWARGILKLGLKECPICEIHVGDVKKRNWLVEHFLQHHWEPSGKPQKRKRDDRLISIIKEDNRHGDEDDSRKKKARLQVDEGKGKGSVGDMNPDTLT